MHAATIALSTARALIVAVGLVLLAAPAVLAIEDGGIGGKPANPRSENPRSQSIFVYELNPGQVIQDEVQVVNNTDVEKTLLLYAVDSQIASGGAFSCAQKVDEPVSTGAWIDISQSEVVVEPHSFKNVPFTVSVPTNASAGESNGCVVVQDAQRSDVSENGGITLSFRSAIRVAITIPGEITKDLVFTGLSAKPLDDKILRYSAGLKNNGNVSLDTDLQIVMKTLWGATVNNAGGTFPVLARSEAAFNFEVQNPFWGGWYTVQPTAAYDPETNSSLGESGASKTINGNSLTLFVAPQPLALAIEILATLAVLIAIAYFVLKYRSTKTLHLKAKIYSVSEGDTLQTIANKAGVSWRNIAKVNNLKPPYHLEPGQKIKITHK